MNSVSGTMGNTVQGGTPVVTGTPWVHTALSLALPTTSVPPAHLLPSVYSSLLPYSPQIPLRLILQTGGGCLISTCPVWPSSCRWEGRELKGGGGGACQLDPKHDSATVGHRDGPLEELPSWFWGWMGPAAEQ